MNTCTSDDQSSETWIEVHALGGSERAACFVTFLLQAVPGAELGFGPRAGDAYRFHLAAPPSTLIRALLESSEFTPAGLRVLESGDLQVTLHRAERDPESAHREASAPPVHPNGSAPAAQTGARPASDEAEETFSPAWMPIAAEDLLAEPEFSEADLPVPLDGALEQLDSAIGELLEQLTVETAPPVPDETVAEADHAVPLQQPAAGELAEQTELASVREAEAVEREPAEEAAVESVAEAAASEDEPATDEAVEDGSVGARHASPDAEAGEILGARASSPSPAGDLAFGAVAETEGDGGASEEALAPAQSFAAQAGETPALPAMTAIPASLPVGEREEPLVATSQPSVPHPEPAEGPQSSEELEEAGEKRYHIVLGDDCPVCRAVSRISFTADRPPQLPIAGCRATDGCGCSLPEFEPETHRTGANPGMGERGLAFHGQIQLVAHPFGNFGRLNQFITMVGALPGVRSVTLRRFRNGILRLAVDYAGSAPLSTQLTTMMEIPLEIVSDSGDLIEIAVTDDGRDKQPSLELVSIAARGTSQRRPASA